MKISNPNMSPSTNALQELTRSSLNDTTVNQAQGVNAEHSAFTNSGSDFAKNEQLNSGSEQQSNPDIIGDEKDNNIRVNALAPGQTVDGRGGDDTIVINHTEQPWWEQPYYSFPGGAKVLGGAGNDHVYADHSNNFHNTYVTFDGGEDYDVFHVPYDAQLVSISDRPDSGATHLTIKTVPGDDSFQETTYSIRNFEQILFADNLSYTRDPDTGGWVYERLEVEQEPVDPSDDPNKLPAPLPEKGPIDPSDDLPTLPDPFPEYELPVFSS